MPKIQNTNIYKRKNGYYQAVIKIDKITKCFTCKNKDKLVKKVKEFLKECHIYPDFNGNGEIENIITVWLDSVKKPFISSYYYKTLKNVSARYIFTHFKNVKIKNIKPIQLQNFFNEVCEKSTRVAEDVKTVLNGACEYAVANGLILTNPMRAVILTKHERKQGRALTPDELVFFKSEIEKHPVYKLPFIIFLYTGCRSSEFKSIKFNFDTNVITIKNSKLKKHQKNYFREIPIFKMLLPFRDEILKDEWRNVYLNELTKAFKKIFNDGNIRWLRHTFQTYCRQKASKEIVNMWAGHVIAKDMTDAVYNHIFMSEQQEVAKLIEY